MHQKNLRILIADDEKEIAEILGKLAVSSAPLFFFCQIILYILNESSNQIYVKFWTEKRIQICAVCFSAFENKFPRKVDEITQHRSTNSQKSP